MAISNVSKMNTVIRVSGRSIIDCKMSMAPSTSRPGMASSASTIYMVLTVSRPGTVNRIRVNEKQ